MFDFDDKISPDTQKIIRTKLNSLDLTKVEGLTQVRVFRYPYEAHAGLNQPIFKVALKNARGDELYYDNQILFLHTPESDIELQGVRVAPQRKDSQNRLRGRR